VLSINETCELAIEPLWIKADWAGRDGLIFHNATENYGHNFPSFGNSLHAV
jgi:hypothetical protein